MVSFLTAPYAEARRKFFFDDCLLLFACGKTIGSLVLVACTSIVATVRRDILLIYSSLGPEDTWMKASHA